MIGKQTKGTSFNGCVCYVLKEEKSKLLEAVGVDGTLRLTDMQYTLLGAICRRTKRNQSEVIRSFIENGSVRERITQEHIYIIRQLIGESTNLNQLARQANTYGFSAVAKRCEEMAERINQLIKRLKDDR